MRRTTVVLALLLAACAHDLWIVERLYFGRSISGGGAVSDAEWSAFVRDIVTPRFPDGLTIYDARGQWRDASGTIVAEPVTVIEILHPRPDERAIEEIVAEYKRRFRQESVLRVRGRGRVEF